MIDGILRQLLVAGAGLAFVLAPALLLRLAARRDVVLRHRLMLGVLTVMMLALILQALAPARFAEWRATGGRDAAGQPMAGVVTWLQGHTGMMAIGTAGPAAPPRGAASVPGAAGAGAPAARAVSAALNPALGVLVIYVAGVALSLLFLVLGWNRARSLVRRCRPVSDVNVLAAWRRAQQIIETRGAVRLVESDEVFAPACRGGWSGVVIVPSGHAAHGESLVCALCHELVHLSRFDPAVALAQRLVIAAFWFHPLVRIFDAMLSRDRELSCDAQVVRCMDNPRTYAHALLDFCCARPAAAGLAGFDSATTIKRRIEMIALARNVTSIRSMAILAGGLGLCAAIALGAHVALAAAMTAPKDDYGNTDKASVQVKVQSARAGIESATVEAPPLVADLPLLHHVGLALKGGNAGRLTGTYVEQETLLSADRYYEVVERFSSEERRSTARLELSDLILNLPEGSALRAEFEGRRVVLSENEGATDITVHAGAVRVFDAAGLARAIIRPKSERAPLRLRAEMVHGEVSFTVSAEGDREERLVVELDLTPAPATEVDKKGAVEMRYQVLKPDVDTENAPLRVKMQWVIDTTLLAGDKNVNVVEEQPRPGSVR